MARELEGAERVLIVGPSTAKLQFVRHAHKHDPALEPRIVGVETVDHPTDRQLVAYSKRYFALDERVQGRHPAEAQRRESRDTVRTWLRGNDVPS